MSVKKNRKWLWISIIAILALFTLAIIKAKNRPKGDKVYTEEVKKRDIREIVSASGKIYPKTEVKISSDVSGEIVALYVKEGDTVKAGQLLAKIDPDAYVSQVDRGVASLNVSKSQMESTKKAIESARAQKEQITSQLENSKQVFARNQKLHTDGVISDAEFEASKASMKALEANLKAANTAIAQAEENVRASGFGIKSSEATLNEVKKSLSRTSILAPTNGIISKLNVEKGERVVGTIQMTGTEMMRIANLNIMEVQAEVSENDILRVQLGNSVDIDVDAYPNKKFKGTVTEISNSSTTASLGTTGSSLATDKITNFIVKIIIDQASYADLIKPGRGFPFRPGMSASVEITTNLEKNIICVPIQAVTTREDKVGETENGDSKDANLKEVVFIPSNDTLRMVEVKTGIQDDAYIQIISGVNVGEKVVAGPYALVSRTLKRGSKVHVVKKEEINASDKSDKATGD
ncbi:MAG: efflux RND transporter periplasmic adaptor subunit [Saprospiraceae bacterium]|jgi:HlyD family secretion protein|nr:efflux RND transporter periplasmic adaptor subunit [Saprospiraceae bacterium]